MRPTRTELANLEDVPCREADSPGTDLRDADVLPSEHMDGGQATLL